MNTNILILIPNYWGKAATIKAAWDRIRQEAGSRTVAEAKREGKWVIWACHPDSYCEDVNGGIVSPKDSPPTRIDWGKAVDA